MHHSGNMNIREENDQSRLWLLTGFGDRASHIPLRKQLLSEVF